MADLKSVSHSAMSSSDDGLGPLLLFGSEASLNKALMVPSCWYCSEMFWS